MPNKQPDECSDLDGVLVGLIDSIINAAQAFRLLYEYPPSDAIKAAFEDLTENTDISTLLKDTQCR